MKFLSKGLALILSVTLVFTVALAVNIDIANAESSFEPELSKAEELSNIPETENPEAEGKQESDQDIEELSEDNSQAFQEQQVEELYKSELQDSQNAENLRTSSDINAEMEAGTVETSFESEEASGDEVTDPAAAKAPQAAPAAEPEPETYTVTWLDYNGNTLETDENVAAGTAPKYDGAAPARAATQKYKFTFAGWAAASGASAADAVSADSLPAVTADATYYAVYSYALRAYKVKFVNGYGGTICTRTVYYGKAAKAPAAPKRKGYDFAGWNKAFTKISGNLTVTAKWKKHVHSYKWTVNTKATYFREGKKTGVCSCGRKVTKVIPKLTGKNIWIRDSRGNRYYLNSKGQFLTRWNRVKLQGTDTVYWAYFDSKGRYKVSYSAGTKNMFMIADNSRFYFDSNCKPVGWGFHYIANDLYHMNKYGAVQYGTFKGKDGYTYYANSQGHIGGIALYRYRYGTFVLVDRSDQTFYYYSDMARRLTGDLVTGMRGRSDTPTGVYSIRSKLRGIYLTGPTWRSYVNYWMAFIGSSYGLHDAPWRPSSDFSDHSTYTRNGSHGCVNMRQSDAARLYELVSIGTTVIVQD